MGWIFGIGCLYLGIGLVHMICEDKDDFKTLINWPMKYIN